MPPMQPLRAGFSNQKRVDPGSKRCRQFAQDRRVASSAADRDMEGMIGASEKLQGRVFTDPERQRLEQPGLGELITSALEKQHRDVHMKRC